MITDRLTRKRTVVTPHSVTTPDMAATQQAAPQQATPQQPEVKPQQAEMPKAAQPALNTVRESIKSVLPQIQQQIQAKPEQTVQTEQTLKTAAQKPLTYQDMIDYLKQGDEEYEKKKARNMAIAGAGDVISSIANLIAVNKGAANAYTPALTNAYRDYYDKLKAQRDADNAAMMSYYFKNVENEMAQDAADREQANKDREYGLELGKAETEKADKERARALEKMRADIDQFEAETDRMYKEGLLKNKGGELASRKKLQDAMANKYNQEAIKTARETKDKDKKLLVMGQLVDVPEEVWNSTNIDNLFEMLPLSAEERKGSKTVKEGATGAFGGSKSEVTYKPYTREQKEDMIGRYLNNPAVAKELLDMLGIENDIQVVPNAPEEVETEEWAPEQPAWMQEYMDNQNLGSLLPTDEEESEYGGSLLR